MSGKYRSEMWSRYAAWITVIAVLSLFLSSDAARETTQKKVLDPGTVQMLSNILESLDTFRNDRLRDLEKIRLSTPNGNATVSRSGDVTQLPMNSSVSEHIKALKEGIMGHNPVKKTFGYKVTVYTSPLGENGKDGKPVLVTQYVGGDMMPDSPSRRADEGEDLMESGNHPDKQVVQSESAHLPVHVSVSNIGGGGEGHEAAATKGATDHNRKTEHSESSEKGHQNGHSLHTQSAKAHDHEKHSAKHDEHHKETEKEAHRHDTQAHDKGGATQQGIRERTEIEYYEREHFLDTEYDKAKTGHEKTNGVKEHESHKDHDSHEDKKIHAKDNSHREKSHAGGSLGKEVSAVGAAVPGPHYTPPLLPDHYSDHSPVVHQGGHRVHEDSRALKEDEGSSRLHHSEESKGHREHNAERDHQSEQKDKGYLDKDKGRRKEGYRERGYKITAEREYFLNDAHHDKGHASHTSGSKLKDQEGAAHGSKEGERDRGFVKEEKKEEAHDAAYDSKDRKYYDGEAHSEGFATEKKASSSSGQKKEHEEVIPLAPPVVNYVEEQPHSHPLYPLPIVYAPSNDGAQAVLAYPPEHLTPKTPAANNVHRQQVFDDRIPRNEKEGTLRKQQPLGGYDDERPDLGSGGYVGHASYKKRNPSPLVASIRENVRKDVHAKPPSYSKAEATVSSENSLPNSENAVRFPDQAEGDRRYFEKSEEGSDEVVFPRDGENTASAKYRKEHRGHDPDPVYTQKKSLSQHHDSPDAISLTKQQDKNPYYPDEHKQKRPEFSEQISPNLHPPRSNIRDKQRHTDSRSLYAEGAQNADKLIRTLDRSYPHIQSGATPTVGQLIQELTRYPQEPERYPRPAQRNVNDNTELAYADLHRIYNLNSETHGQRQLRPQNNYRSSEQPILSITSHQQSPHQAAPGRYSHLLQNTQRGEAPLDSLQGQGSPLLNIQQQQQLPRTVSTLGQLQQQTKSPFSPVVLLSRGPPAQRNNQAVDVWYTRQRS